MYKEVVYVYDENQIVKMRWSRGTKRHYESKGYVFTRDGDTFDVFARDLTHGSKMRTIATCDYCGKEYTPIFDNLMRSRKVVNKDACSDCLLQKKHDVVHKKNAERLLGSARIICEENGYELLTTEDEYIDSHMTVKIKCDKHGVQDVNLWALLSNNAGCKECAREITAMKNSLNCDDVERYINSINDNKLLNKEDYKTRKMHNLQVRCSCGNVYTTSLACFILGVHQCYSCSCKESVGECKIRNFLELNEIKFIQEKKFEDCKDILPLPFDFYLQEYNLCIEFDGQHHYESVFGEEEHLKTVEHDTIKNQYCKDNNIDLLRIPYWKENNIEDIIATKLNL